MKQYAGLFWVFFKLGLFTIGGGMAMLPLMQKVVVDDKKWLSNEEMIDCFAVSQALPGVIAVSAAAYIGKRLKGIKGSVAAALGVITPSFLIITAVVMLLGAVGDNPYVNGALTGIKAAVCGLILVTVYRLGKQILKGAFQWVVAVLAFVLIAVFQVTALWAIIGGAAAGVLFLALRQGRGGKEG